MEDGSKECDHAKNGVVAPIMANFPEGTVAVTKEDKPNNLETTKVNGDKNIEEDCSSESDALIIDESVPNKQKSPTKNKQTKVKVNKKVSEVITHCNPYFNESIFELSQQHLQEPASDSANKNVVVGAPSENSLCKHKQKRGKSKAKPKLREYAQYLGLQPTVQFKCSKCGRAGFESLNTLQEHVVQCDSVQNTPILQTVDENSCSGFKLTRKVFLCSACGTYYENWNLYMHMLEFHRRYICLYCLGMFSVLEDLCQHIQSRHNLEPGHKNSLDEFFNVYNEPCYITCCECNKLFSEQDNFFYHNCVNSVNKTNQKNKTSKSVKQQITPENHVTGESLNDTVAESNLGAESQDLVEKLSSETGGSDQEAADKQNSTSHLIATETGDVAVTAQSDKVVQEETTENLEENTNLQVKDENLDVLDDNQDSNITNCSTENVNSTLEKMDEELNGDASPKSDKFEENHHETTEMEKPPTVEPVETRKVPKLSLKLPKPGSYPEPELEVEDSDDSEKLTMEVEQIESENDNDDNNLAEFVEEENLETSLESQMQVAGLDVPIIELELELPLDKFDIRVLLQKCLKATAPICVYCNHARKIAVNGKQLGLHAIAEHRFSGIVNSITAEELIPESFVNKIKENFQELELVFFNLESSASDEAVTFSHIFECFPCRYTTAVHKELYLHNRKLHAKNLLLCIMCKSNFYSYSELVCHLCPGLYVLDYDLQFRCCMCVSDDLPSSFRLMVHLRKRHHVCDVCLEMCHNQYKLSNHVWKHKLHHFCYRCGIAYRNKPDITRHLFWKHGTESVLCKKCLQKKWPHVYHFCVPPAVFVCDECSLTFSKAVALKVHKRIHSNEKKHACIFEGCEEMFISKKLMLKHEAKHHEPVPEPKLEEALVEEAKLEEVENLAEEVKVEEKVEEKPKPKVDVYDLPALNLSESDSSDSEPETVKEEQKSDDNNKQEVSQNEILEETTVPDDNNVDIIPTSEETDAKQTEVIQNIWDNFKNYQANKEKLDHLFVDPEKSVQSPQMTDTIIPEELTAEIALRDHDYCIDPEKKTDTTLIEVKPDLTMTERVDHDYCSPKVEGRTAEKGLVDEKPKGKADKKIRTNSSSSDSSSDSGSSSCSCGSNCSCSSSSGSSSSTTESSESDSSTEEGRRRQKARKLRRKERGKKKVKESESKIVDVVATDLPPAPILVEIPILESDLETTESDTDEEFYDRQPQKLAKKILEEKRKQLLAIMGTNIPNGTAFIESTSRPPTPPSYVVEEEPKPKKKSKSKKRKKKKMERRELENKEYSSSTTTPHNIPMTYYQYRDQYQPQTVAPITLSLRNSPVSTPSDNGTLTAAIYSKANHEHMLSRQESHDLSLRASKRRRVPNKFYGYSSDEEHDKTILPVAKWRKVETTPSRPHSPKIVPPITIKTGPPPAPPQPTVEPLSIRTTSNPGEMRIHHRIPPIRLLPPRPRPTVAAASTEKDSGTDSNDSSAEEQPQPQIVPMPPPRPNQPQLYCYCRCPYDEVSEMIGCDSSECEIEWFHFECVGIMVPPKGQWYCPDCRKKKQQRRELQQT